MGVPRAAAKDPIRPVGAGPAGLTKAITLARHGVECLLVERRSESSSYQTSNLRRHTGSATVGFPLNSEAQFTGGDRNAAGDAAVPRHKGPVVEPS
jgi:flavin-dependent dehydrogenase